MLFFVHHTMDLEARQEFWKDVKRGELLPPERLVQVVGDAYIRPNAWEMYFYAEAPDAASINEALKPYDRYVKDRKVDPVVPFEQYLKQIARLTPEP
jgi:hypothetical protein